MVATSRVVLAGVDAAALPFATAVKALCSKESLALVGAVTGAEASRSTTAADDAVVPPTSGTDAVCVVSTVAAAAAGRPIPVTRPEDTATTTPPRPMVAA